MKTLRSVLKPSNLALLQQEHDCAIAGSIAFNAGIDVTIENMQRTQTCVDRIGPPWQYDQYLLECLIRRVVKNIFAKINQGGDGTP